MELVIPVQHVLKTLYHSPGGALARAKERMAPLLLNFLQILETGRIKLANPPNKQLK